MGRRIYRACHNKPKCKKRLTKGDKLEDRSGNIICYKCWKRDYDEAKRERGVAELQDVLTKKVKSLDNAMKVEAKKRYVLEGKVMDRLLITGEYKLERKDSKLVPNDVVAHMMEEAELDKKSGGRRWPQSAASF